MGIDESEVKSHEQYVQLVLQPLLDLNSVTVTRSAKGRNNQLSSSLSSPVYQDRHIITIPGYTVQARRSFFEPTVKDVFALPLKLLTATRQVLLQQLQALSADNSLVPDCGAAQAGDMSCSIVNRPVSGYLEGLLRQYSDLASDAVQNHLRELRIFYREALGNLFKSKKYYVFMRPVEPEAVPDYYDVILSPMDLETMRMKVDANLYPTYKYFVYDVEQIMHNAREYNPTVNAKDSRGRSIVHNANSLLDEVNFHAFHFNRQLGYDLFKICEDIHMVGLNACMDVL